MDNNKQQQELVDIIQRNEKKSRARFLSWIALCLILGLLTIYYGYVSQQKSKQLLEQTKELESKKDTLERLAVDLEASRKEVTASKDTLRMLLAKTETQLKDPALKAAIKKEISNTATSGYIVYIQEFGTNGGRVSKEIQNSLKQKGFSVPGIEKMRKEFKSRITYFHEEDLEMANNIYEETKKVIQSMYPDFDVEQLKPKPSNLKASSKLIEVWINI